MTKAGLQGAAGYPSSRHSLPLRIYRLERRAGRDAAGCAACLPTAATRPQAGEEVQAAKVQIVSGSPAVAAVEWLAAQPGVDAAGFDPAWTIGGRFDALEGGAARPGCGGRF